MNGENELNKRKTRQENVKIFAGSDAFKEDGKKDFTPNLFIIRSNALC